jgi:hypothetical protein
MSYFNRSQLPYYNALVDAFTIGATVHAELCRPSLRVALRVDRQTVQIESYAARDQQAISTSRVPSPRPIPIGSTFSPAPTDSLCEARPADSPCKARPGPALPCGIESIRNAKAYVAVQVKSYVMLDDDEPTTGVNWETMAETLEKAGVSWKLYQEVIYSTSD